MFCSSISAHEKPDPNSIPFTAPRETTADARRASSFSNTGSPRPAGTPVMRHSTIPPVLFSLFRQFFHSFYHLCGSPGVRSPHGIFPLFRHNPGFHRICRRLSLCRRLFPPPLKPVVFSPQLRPRLFLQFPFPRPGRCPRWSRIPNFLRNV